MSSETEYRKYAAYSLDLANKLPNDADKGLLLVMAEAWRDLADRIARRGKQQRHGTDHPLVEETLGPNRPSAE